jgi:hypothetical protein
MTEPQPPHAELACVEQSAASTHLLQLKPAPTINSVRLPEVDLGAAVEELLGLDSFDLPSTQPLCATQPVEAAAEVLQMPPATQPNAPAQAVSGGEPTVNAPDSEHPAAIAGPEPPFSMKMEREGSDMAADLNQAVLQTAPLRAAPTAGDAGTSPDPPFTGSALRPAPTSTPAALACLAAPMAHHLDAGMPAQSELPLACPPATQPTYAVPKGVGLTDGRVP